MKVVLEISGGFTGSAGKKEIIVDLDRVSAPHASEIRRNLEGLPPTVWGQSFLSVHPNSWDFRHLLRVEDAGVEKTVVFHRNEGPVELTRLGEYIINLDSDVGGAG